MSTSIHGPAGASASSGNVYGPSAASTAWVTAGPTGEPDDSETMWMAEPIVGYRGWNWDGNYLKAGYGPWHSTFMKATHHGDVTSHESPTWSCLCGINVYKEPQGPGTYYPILGKVALTGRVIEFEFGYRGEFGRILHIAIWKGYPKMLKQDPEEFKEDLMKRYSAAEITLERKMPWRK